MRVPLHGPLDVLVLGGAGVDTIVDVPQLPLPYADGYPVPAITTRAGHTGDNVALGLHALGLRTHLVDVLGDDPEGALVRGLHERAGSTFTALGAACRHVHVCITHPGAYALDQLASLGTSVSTDLHDWDGENPYPRAVRRRGRCATPTALETPSSPDSYSDCSRVSPSRCAYATARSRARTPARSRRPKWIRSAGPNCWRAAFDWRR